MRLKSYRLVCVSFKSTGNLLSGNFFRNVNWTVSSDRSRVQAADGGDGREERVHRQAKRKVGQIGGEDRRREEADRGAGEETVAVPWSRHNSRGSQGFTGTGSEGLHVTFHSSVDPLIKSNEINKIEKAEEERVARQRLQVEQLDKEGVRIEQDIRRSKSLMESCATELRACGAGLRNLENRIKETKKQVQCHEELLYDKVRMRGDGKRDRIAWLASTFFCLRLQNLEILRADLELRGLRGAVNDPELRQKQRQEAELLKVELEQNQSHLVALKHELLKTNVTSFSLLSNELNYF